MDKAAAPADNPTTKTILGFSGDVTEILLIFIIISAMLWAGVVYLWSRSPMVLAERNPWAHLRYLPPVFPSSYWANQSQMCCLNCIAGSTCI